MRRTMLFLPSNNPNMLINGGQLGADSLIFDLEDAVSPDEKDAARELLKIRWNRWILASASESSASTAWTPITGWRICARFYRFARRLSCRPKSAARPTSTSWTRR